MVENITLNHGDKLLLKCTIDANPWCEQIRWLFNEQELAVRPCTKDRFTEYLIDRIDRSQAGRYVCEVKNSLNASFSSSYDGITVASTDVRVQCKDYRSLAAL